MTAAIRDWLTQASPARGRHGGRPAGSGGTGAAFVPDAIDDIVAASLPLAYLTAQTTLTLAEFKPGKTVLAPGIGGSVGNATYQLARAQGAGKVISTAGSVAKAAKARGLGFEDVIDLTSEGLADGVEDGRHDPVALGDQLALHLHRLDHH